MIPIRITYINDKKQMDLDGQREGDVLCMTFSEGGKPHYVLPEAGVMLGHRP